jgi:hydrogenase nickel incorporation protein HypA/HybF
MHELSIAASVIDTIRAEMQSRPGVRLLGVGLRIGELAGVDPDSLRFGFEALVSGTDLDPLRIDIEHVPRRHLCQICRAEFTIVNYMTICPTCSSPKTRCISGDELDIAYLEVDEA